MLGFGPAACLVTALIALASARLAAQEPDPGPDLSFGGLAFGDLYYVQSHHSAEGDGARGAVVRRLYLTLDADFGATWFARLRTETNQSGEFETYSFETDFKDLHVGRRFGRHTLRMGLAPTPTFDLIESIWGLRYLVRTPLDLQGVASRDTGIAAQGPLNGDETLLYRVMLGAGLEFGTESDDARKRMAALTWKPAPSWTLDLYLDYEGLAGPVDRTTWQVFAGYETEALRAGLQYSNQSREEDAPLELASGFIIGRLNDRTSLVGRIDRLFEPSPKGDDIAYLPFDPTAKATMLVGGVEFRLTERFTLTPNLVSIQYDRNDAGVRPQHDAHWRLTFFVDLE